MEEKRQRQEARKAAVAAAAAGAMTCIYFAWPKTTARHRMNIYPPSPPPTTDNVRAII